MTLSHLELFKNIVFFMIIVFLLSSAEKFLESVEVNQNYPLLLLHLVDRQDVHLTIRVAGAVAFKNYIKRNWKVVSAMFILVLASVCPRFNINILCI
jgi:hypothetical protein